MKSFWQGIFRSLEGRKFFLTFLTLITATVLVWITKIGDSIYRDIIIGVIAVYISGNVAQKAFESRKDSSTNVD